MGWVEVIGDTVKDRRIDYDLIDKLNKECEAKARREKLEGRLAGKRKKKGVEEEKEEPAAEQTIPKDINYINTPDELRDIKGNYSLHKGIYTIDFEIIVPQGNALILQPGVKLYLTKDAGITCAGRFEARGTKGLEVLLTAKDQEDGWKNLYLKGGAEGVLDYAKFSYGKGRTNSYSNISGGAICLEAKNELKPNLTIINSIFEHNSTMNCGGAISNFKGNVIIKENNRFENNSAKELGGAILNHKGTLNIDKSKNTFIGNKPDNIYED